jgi:hypothetical protein
MEFFLSKTDYQTARRCLKRLWHEKKQMWIPEQTVSDKKNAFEGNRFNEAVHAKYPTGLMVGWQHGSLDDAISKTKELLNQDEVTLFEATFEHQGLLCMADVLVKDKTGLTLIEAKSSNNPKITKKDKFEHVYDAAFQSYVMAKCGYKPSKVELLHANSECVFPDIDNLFLLEDITELVDERLGEIEITAPQYLEHTKSKQTPTQLISKHCKKPKDKACPHINECWELPVEKTIHDLPRLPEKTTELLRSLDIHLIEGIPSDITLSESLQHKVNLIQNQTEYLDKEKTKEFLSQLTYPLHFFDFETYNPAVPMWEQSRPWQQVPFQYSLHILHEGGEIEHFEFLQMDTSDPRPPMIEAMQNHFKSSGSVVVYYQPFEKSRLKEMATDFPEHRDFLMAIHDRVWDQMDIFSKCVEDHRLALSTSIKVVLPTYIPELSYKDLDVQKGDQAQLEWRKMIDLKWQPTKEKLADSLKAYCELDTWAMVKLHQYLEQEIESL